MIDLDRKYLAEVMEILACLAPDCEVWVFGSRLSGQARPFSDLDLVLVGKEKLSLERLGTLKDAFAESGLPIMVDLLDWHTLSPEFRTVDREKSCTPSEGCTMNLGHRERVLRSLEGKDFDRPPAFFRAETPVRERLKHELGAGSDLELASHFETDAVHVNVVYHKHKLRKDNSPDHFYDKFGNRYRRVSYDGMYSETVVEPVLAGATDPAQVARIQWPDPGMIDMEASLAQAREARAAGLAVYGGVWASVFTHSRAMLGEEDYLVALVENPELISVLITRLTDCFLELNRAYLDRCAQYLDIFYFGSDFGTQDSMFISPGMFREFYKPHLASLAAQAHSYGLKVMYHTCGSVHPIINDLAECGIDILDPVQVSAAGMNAAGLSARFKGTIAFHGGISTQTVLPKGDPEDVREAVESTIRELGPERYIVAPDQDLMEDVPTENIEALFRAVRETRL